MPSFPIHLSNSEKTIPGAPITTGTISKFLNVHNLRISFFKSLYLSTFSFSFFSTLTSAGTAIPAIIPFCSFLPITIRSDHLAFSRLSHWIFMSNSTFVSQFSTAPSRACSPQFHCVLTHSFYKYSNELSFQHCRVFFCICFETIFHTRLLCVAHFHLFSHTIYTEGLSLVLLMWYFI